MDSNKDWNCQRVLISGYFRCFVSLVDLRRFFGAYEEEGQTGWSKLPTRTFEFWNTFKLCLFGTVAACYLRNVHPVWHSEFRSDIEDVRSTFCKGQPAPTRSNFWLCKTSQEPSELGILGAESSRAMRLLHVWLICWLPSWAWGSPEAFPVKDVQTWSVVLETGKMSLKKGHDRLLDFSQAYATTMPTVAVVSYSGWLVNFQVGMDGLHKVF